MASLIWLQGDDFDATYNFRSLITRGISNDELITLTTYTDYSKDYSIELDIDFTQDAARFDDDYFDDARFADSNAIIIWAVDINRCDQNLFLKFEQNEENTNIGLVQMQLDFSKNGNRNK